MTKWISFGVALALACISGCGGSGYNNNSGGCSLVGTWNGTVSGQAETVVYTSGGMFTVTVGGSAGPAGTFSLSGTTLTLTDPSCGSTVKGTYTVTFSGDCNTATAALISDACTQRAGGVDGQTFTRQ